MPEFDGSWVPETCTLPTVDRPLRVAQFDELFASAVVAVTRVDGQRARFELRPQPVIAATAADLSVRETQCCSFFEFALTATGGRLALEVAVPPGQVAVLDALTDRARTAAGGVAS